MANKHSFRWVECQFESLKRCPRSESHLERCLRSLPRGLDETYERILCNIDEGLIEEARRILTLLCFASRPLTVPELIDGIAVDLNEPTGLVIRRRLHDANDFLELCPGLIEVDKVDEVDAEENEVFIKSRTPILRIAHFSVQEYLESDRIRQQRAMAFGLQTASAHTELAQICLVYLQEPGLSSGNLDEMKLKKFSLAQYAASFWHHHYNAADNTELLLDNIILRMFRDCQNSFSTWVDLYDVYTKGWSRSQPNHAAPLYYASLLGLDRIVHELLKFCQDDTVERQNLINSQGGPHGNALQVASETGHEKVVQILLDAGADENIRDYHKENSYTNQTLKTNKKV